MRNDAAEYMQVKLVLTVKVGTGMRGKHLLQKMRETCEDIHREVLFQFNDETEVELRYRQGFGEWTYERAIMSPARATRGVNDD
jgi:formamidopyrimidine-DNA glycosylase